MLHFGGRNIPWPPTYFQGVGVRTPNPQDLRPWQRHNYSCAALKVILLKMFELAQFSSQNIVKNSSAVRRFEVWARGCIKFRSFDHSALELPRVRRICCCRTCFSELRYILYFIVVLTYLSGVATKICQNHDNVSKHGQHSSPVYRPSQQVLAHPSLMQLHSCCRLDKNAVLCRGYNYDSTAIRPRDVHSTTIHHESTPTCARARLRCGLNK